MTSNTPFVSFRYSTALSLRVLTYATTAVPVSVVTTEPTTGNVINVSINSIESIFSTIVCSCDINAPDNSGISPLNGRKLSNVGYAKLR